MNNNGIEISYVKNGNNLKSNVTFTSPNLNYPVKVYFIIYGTDIWNVDITSSGMWCELPNSRNVDIRVIDNNGDLILNKIWEHNSNSDTVEIEFLKWCRDFHNKKSYKPCGVVIGSHSGVSGEWVEAYNSNLIGKTLLIEPNIVPFNKLVSNYQSDSRFSFLKSVVSESDDFVDFYTNENGDSESSSLIESNLLKSSDNSFKNKVKSISPKSIFKNYKVNWLHIDAEGYDANILFLISDEDLLKVEFIIWEHIHLTEEVKFNLSNRLQNLGFYVEVGLEYNTFAVRV
jgi:FkbM family methyltransferase